MGFYCDVSLYGIMGGRNHSLQAGIILYEPMSSSTVELIGKQTGVHVNLSDRSIVTDSWGVSYALYQTPTTPHLSLDSNAPSTYSRRMDLDSRIYPLIPNEDIIIKIDENEYDTTNPTVNGSFHLSWQVFQ